MPANARKQSRSPKLDELLAWESRALLDSMLDEGISPNKCIEWANSMGLSISGPTLYSYAKKRKKTIMDSVAREGTGRYKGTDPKTGRFTKREDNFSVNQVVSDRSRTKVKNELELLDYVIQHGMDALQDNPVPPNLALKAIELKHKITAGSHMNLTVYGFEEIKVRERAREEAILTVLKQFVPEDSWMDCLKAMEEATKAYYVSVGLGDKYEADIAGLYDEDEE